MTIEKRVDEFEERILALGRRIADLANVKTECADVLKKLESIQLNIDKFWDWIDSLEKRTEQLDEKIEALPRIVDFRFGLAMEKIGKVAENLAQLVKNHSELEGKFGPLSDKVLEIGHACKSAQSELKDIQLIIGGLKVLISHNQQVSEEINKEVQAYRSFSIAQKEEIKAIKEALCGHDKTHVSISKDIVSERTQLQDKIDRLDEKVNREVSCLASTLTKKIESIVVPDVSKFISQSELDSFKHQIALVTLDAKNSLTRSTNNDMQLQILAKKVDGLQFQIRTQELTTQG